jgi:dolichol kinase
VSTEGPVLLSLRGELTRKALHLGWAVVPVLYASGVSRDRVVLLLVVATAAALGVELARWQSDAVRSRFQRLTGELLRAHEHLRVSGATWLLVSFLTVVIVFEAPIAIAGMWAVAVGDASAALVGRTFGRLRIGQSMKTIEGSATCVLMTAAGAFLVAGLSPLVSLVAGLIAAAAEWPSWPLDDNIRVGVMVSAGILLCHMAFS